MRYPICSESRRVLDELDHLRTEARALLDAASPGAREEWEKLESRFPSDLEIRRGHIALSKPELDEMRSKVQRFRDILATGQGGPPIPSTATDAARHRNKLTHSRSPSDA